MERATEGARERQRARERGGACGQHVRRHPGSGSLAVPPTSPGTRIQLRRCVAILATLRKRKAAGASPSPVPYRPRYPNPRSIKVGRGLVRRAGARRHARQPRDGPVGCLTSVSATSDSLLSPGYLEMIKSPMDTAPRSRRRTLPIVFHALPYSSHSLPYSSIVFHTLPYSSIVPQLPLEKTRTQLALRRTPPHSLYS